MPFKSIVLKTDAHEKQILCCWHYPMTSREIVTPIKGSYEKLTWYSKQKEDHILILIESLSKISLN